MYSLRKKKMVEHVPDEVVENILVRLPPTSVLVFKSVCKAWLRVIDDPRFVDKHMQYQQYLLNRQVVHFRSPEKPNDDDFQLELSKISSYDVVVRRVAQQLGVDSPLKIRLTPYKCSYQPSVRPIKYRGVDNLSDMLVQDKQLYDILYYEIFDTPLPVLEFLKTLRVEFYHPTKDEVVIHKFILLKETTVGDLLNYLKTKVELSHPKAELRLLEVFYHKIYQIFPTTEGVENINDQYWTLRAEEIPEEEKTCGPLDHVIHVYHFKREVCEDQMLRVENFGEPFLFVIHDGESLAKIKVRIQKKLQVPNEEFSQWKFAVILLGRPKYLQDNDIVSGHFGKNYVYGAWETYLALEHSNISSSTKTVFAANQNRYTFVMLP